MSHGLADPSNSLKLLTLSLSIIICNGEKNLTWNIMISSIIQVIESLGKSFNPLLSSPIRKMEKISVGPILDLWYKRRTVRKYQKNHNMLMGILISHPTKKTIQLEELSMVLVM